MEKLETARSALVDAARTAGKSEIATGILHNVGNVLNSANVSANVLAEKVKSMRVNDIETLSRILAENASRLGEFIERDPRGKHVQPALAALSQHMATQKGGILKEIESLGEAIERIRSLVKSQQSFAVKAVTEEPVDVREQIRKAISLTEKASGPDASLEFEYELDDIPDLLVDRHRLLEILVNIIQNARQAMDAHENHPKRLVLRTREYPKGRVRIEVTDSGVGIVKENLVKVFTLGFTTKPNGHGFGLHAAANAATEIDGSLTVHSDGPGKGATFVLEIPMRVAPVLVTAGARS
jgi:signal transduction histidine kinase